MPRASVAERLLAGARDAWLEPMRVRHIGRTHDMERAGIQDPRCREGVRDDVQGPERLVHRDFQDRCSGIERGVDGTGSPRTPTAAHTIAALAAVPGRGEDRLIQPPQEQVARPEGWLQRRHV